MKKILILVSVFAFVASVATAEIGLAVGAKGVFGFPIGTQRESSFDNNMQNMASAAGGVTTKNMAMANGGGALFVRYELPWGLPLNNKIGFQLETAFNANNGISKTYESNDKKIDVHTSFHTIDIPLLVTYRFPIGIVDFRVGVGPNFGIAVGDASYKFRESGVRDEDTIKSEITKRLIIGLAFEFAFGFHLGRGAFVTNIRYLNDFTKLEIKEINSGMKSDLLLRRNLSFSLGYEVRF